MKITNLRIERERRKWSQEFLGQQLGITGQAVNLIETLKRNPSYPVLCGLEKEFYPLKHDYLLAQVKD